MRAKLLPKKPPIEDTESFLRKKQLFDIFISPLTIDFISADLNESLKVVKVLKAKCSNVLF